MHRKPHRGSQTRRLSWPWVKNHFRRRSTQPKHCCIRTITVLAMLVSTSAVFAETYCEGKVKFLNISDASGVLQLDIGTGVHYICKPKQTMNGVYPAVCKAWYSMFLAAQAADKSIRQHYLSKDPEICTKLPNWEVPRPFPNFIELVD